MNERRVRLLVEVDVVIVDDEWVLDDVLHSAADRLDGIVHSAERNDPHGRYAIETDDLTVWDPIGYLGELMSLQRMSKTAKSRMRAYAYLPARDRHDLYMAKLVRQSQAVPKGRVT